MAFYKPIYPEWVKFPKTAMPGIKKKHPRFWSMGEVYTGKTNDSYVESSQTPKTEYITQGSMMQTPSVDNLGRFSPKHRKTKLFYSFATKFLPARGFAERTKLKRYKQFKLIPSAELPFNRVTKVPKYVSDVQEIAGIRRPKKMSIWRGRTNFGMMRPMRRMTPFKMFRSSPFSTRPRKIWW